MPDDHPEGGNVVGRISSRLYPGLDEALWRRQRRRQISRARTSGRYDDLTARRPLLPLTSIDRRNLDRSTRVVVVPQEGDDFDSFRPGTRNLYYEAAQTLRETLGPEHVSVFTVPRGAPSATWHVALLDFLIDVGATHMLTHIEHDPGTAGASFSWDVFWSLASTRWDGVLLGVMFDSSYKWIAASSRHLARISPRFMVVDICMPMDGSMVRRRSEVGPVNMPVSRESLALVDERLAGVKPIWDLSFIGVMYPYRVQLVDQLRDMGISVAVNPHRTDRADDPVSSRADQPSWLDYMAGLRSSRMTINFSQSSAGPFEQLKTRVLEATLAGTLLLTDDRDRTRRFWIPGEEYGCFAGPAELPGVVQGFLADPVRLERVRAAGQAKARSLAHTNFWGGIEVGLNRRGLPPLGLP